VRRGIFLLNDEFANRVHFVHFCDYATLNENFEKEMWIHGSGQRNNFDFILADGTRAVNGWRSLARSANVVWRSQNPKLLTENQLFVDRNSETVSIGERNGHSNW
jgi:hypothetical protein